MKAPVRIRTAVQAVLIGTITAWTAHGGSWTNVAGRAIEADLLDIKGEIAVFRLSDGSEMRLPLLSLAPPERIRARRMLSIPDIPAPIRTDFDHCRRLLSRLQTLRIADDITWHEQAARQRKALDALARSCARAGLDAATTARVLRAAGQGLP